MGSNQCHGKRQGMANLKLTQHRDYQRAAPRSFQKESATESFERWGKWYQRDSQIVRSQSGNRINGRKSGFMNGYEV